MINQQIQPKFWQNCATIAGIILFIILLFISWDTVEITRYGLLCNTLTKSCSNSVYEAGRHWVWPFYYFIQFPGSYQTIEFSDHRKANAPLKTRTAEGLSLELFLSFQYKLIKNKLPSLYGLNNLEYERTFTRIARDTIVQIASTYEAPQYWQKRHEIGIKMKEELDKELQKAYANCVYFQILRIDLPDTFDVSIVNTQVEMQNKRMKQFEQEAVKILKEIEVLKSETERQIKTINAEASAEQYKILKEADSKATKSVLEAETDVYSFAQQENEFNQQELNDYIYYLSLTKQKKAKMLVGMNEIQARIE